MRDVWVRTGHGRLFARTWGQEQPGAGDQAPIILFHDSLGCVAVWRDFPKHLAQATGRRVIAYDRLGFGRSDPHRGRLDLTFIRDEAHDPFAALRDRLGIQEFVLLGHSVGGAMAAVAAGAFPEQCRGLITESAQAFVDDKIAEGIRNAKRAFEQDDQRDRLKKYHGDKADWVLSAWIDSWLSPGFAAWNLDNDLPLVRCPTLAIHGDSDEYGSTEHADRIGSLTSGPATVEILSNCGHVPHREKECIVIELIGTFLSRSHGA